MHRQTLLATVVLLALATLVGCASDRLRTGGVESLARGSTWAWEASTPTELVDPEGQVLPWSEFRTEIARQLEEHGLAEALPGGADVVLRAELRLATKTRHNDPYFAAFVAERYEELDLIVELLDAETFETLWFGEATHRLRFVERSQGGFAKLRWVPVDQERDWAVSAVVGRILQALPYMDAGD